MADLGWLALSALRQGLIQQGVGMKTVNQFVGKFQAGGVTQYTSRKTGRVYQIWPVGFEFKCAAGGKPGHYRREKTYLVTGNGELISPCVLPRRAVLHLIELDDVF